MSTEIKVPVSAPGASAAAKELDTAATAAERLATAERKVAAESPKASAGVTTVAAATRLTKQELEACNRAVNRFTAEMSATGVRLRPVSDELVRARGEARKLKEQLDGTGHGAGGHQKDSAYWLSRLAPGHEMQIQNVASAGGAGAIPLIGGLMASMAALSVSFKVSASIAEEHNRIAQENLRVDQELNRATRETLWAKEAEAGNTLKGSRKAARFILNSGPDGEQTIQDLIKSGAGTEGIAAMAALMKSRGNRFGHGATAWTGADFMNEANAVRGQTGMEIPDILQAMASSQGHYNRTRFIREQMGRTYSPELMAMWKEKGDASATGQLLDRAEFSVREENRFRAGNAFNPSVALPGLARELENLVEPMKRIVLLHNLKIEEEIQARQKAVEAEQGLYEWWTSRIDPSGHLISSDRVTARKDVNRLRGNLR